MLRNIINDGKVMARLYIDKHANALGFNMHKPKQ